VDKVLVIGVGNPYRGDDGVGVAVIDRLRDQDHPDIEVCEESGESVALISRWADRQFVIMVDAVTSGAAPGTIARIECSEGSWQVGPRTGAASTHGLGVADAVELGTVLERLPERLLIFGIEAGAVENGHGLTDPVAAVVDEVVQAIIDEAEASVTPA